MSKALENRELTRPSEEFRAFLRDAAHKYTEAELVEGQETFDRYLEVMIRIYKHLEEDTEANVRFRALTSSAQDPTMKGKRSN